MMPYAMHRPMQRLSSLGVRTLLKIGFGAMLIFLALITVLAQLALQRSVDQVQTLATAQAHESELLRDMGTQVSAAYQSLLSSVLLTDPEDLAFQRKTLTEAFTRYAQTDQALKGLMGQAPKDVQTLYATLGQRSEETHRSLDAMMDRIGDPNERETMSAFVANTMQPIFESWQSSLQALDAGHRQAATARTAEVQGQVSTARVGLLIFAGLALLLGLVSATLIARSIVKPLASAVDLAGHVAQGDLSRDIPVTQGGEVGALQQALGQMQASLRELVGQVQQASEGITVASTQIAQGHQDLSMRTEHTASRLQSAASATAQLSDGLHHTAEAAGRAEGMATASLTAARRGAHEVGEVAENMRSIQAGSSRIADITGVIDTIAFQTNVLALNASVEAARAGEEGRGFAVVAEEVRSLAQRCAEASREIRTLIEANVKAVTAGHALVNGTVRSMGEIAEGVERVTTIIQAIAADSTRQNDDARVMRDTVEQLDEMTQQNAALVEQGAAAAASLNEESQRLYQLVQVFRLDAGNTASAA